MKFSNLKNFNSSSREMAKRNTFFNEIENTLKTQYGMTQAEARVLAKKALDENKMQHSKGTSPFEVPHCSEEHEIFCSYSHGSGLCI